MDVEPLPGTNATNISVSTPDFFFLNDSLYIKTQPVTQETESVDLFPSLVLFYVRIVTIVKTSQYTQHYSATPVFPAYKQTKG